MDRTVPFSSMDRQARARLSRCKAMQRTSSMVMLATRPKISLPRLIWALTSHKSRRWKTRSWPTTWKTKLWWRLTRGLEVLRCKRRRQLPVITGKEVVASISAWTRDVLKRAQVAGTLTMPRFKARVLKSLQSAGLRATWWLRAETKASSSESLIKYTRNLREERTWQRIVKLKSHSSRFTRRALQICLKAMPSRDQLTRSLIVGIALHLLSTAILLKLLKAWRTSSTSRRYRHHARKQRLFMDHKSCKILSTRSVVKWRQTTLMHNQQIVVQLIERLKLIVSQASVNHLLERKSSIMSKRMLSKASTCRTWTRLCARLLNKHTCACLMVWWKRECHRLAETHRVLVVIPSFKSKCTWSQQPTTLCCCLSIGQRRIKRESL